MERDLNTMKITAMETMAMARIMDMIAITIALATMPRDLITTMTRMTTMVTSTTSTINMTSMESTKSTTNMTSTTSMTSKLQKLGNLSLRH
jgi:hypothetical protein